MRLTGQDDRGQLVDQIMMTDPQGIFEFTGLRPSSLEGYTLTETQPTGYLDGIESLGTVDSVATGDAADNVFYQIGMLRSGSDGVNYNFGERPLPGSTPNRPDGDNRLLAEQERPDADQSRSTAAERTARLVGNWGTGSPPRFRTRSEPLPE